jgi:hypothetical protein
VLVDDYADDKTDPEFVTEHEGSGQVVKVDEGEHESMILKLSSATPPAP